MKLFGLGTSSITTPEAPKKTELQVHADEISKLSKEVLALQSQVLEFAPKRALDSLATKDELSNDSRFKELKTENLQLKKSLYHTQIALYGMIGMGILLMLMKTFAEYHNEHTHYPKPT